MYKLVQDNFNKKNNLQQKRRRKEMEKGEEKFLYNFLVSVRERQLFEWWLNKHVGLKRLLLI